MKSQIKTGTILVYINMAANTLITLFYTPLMLKLMGQSEYGLYSLVASVIGYLSVLDMGFGNSMIRFISRSKARGEADSEKKINGLFLLLYSIIGVIALLVGIALIFNVENIFKALTIEELAKAKVIMGILVFTVAISFPLSIFDSYVTSCEKFKLMKILAILKTLAVPLTMLPLLFLGYKAIAMVIVTSLYTIIFHCVTLYYCFAKLNMKIEFTVKNVDKVLLKEIFGYSFFIFLNIVVDNLYAHTDQVILGAVSGTVAVSIYAVALKISTMNKQFSTNISGVFFPRITKTLEEENGDKKVSDIFIKVSRIQLYVLALILCGLILFGKSFINLWVGKDYMDAYYIILLLIVPAIIPLTQNIGISILQAKNMHKFRSVVYLAIAIFNVIVSIPLARVYAGIGAAIGTAIANVLGQIVTMNIYYWKVAKIDIPTYWKRFLSFMTPLLVVTLVLTYATRNIDFSWKQLVGGAAIFTVLYGLYCLLYMNDTEKGYIKTIKDKFLAKGRKIA
ncbi:MAG: oligosaccharide flippase family protein [Clostridia bacterium]|nr:oligosaccharide flippase family protein [Clostridia bacterium]